MYINGKTSFKTTQEKMLEHCLPIWSKRKGYEQGQEVAISYHQ